MEKKEDQDKRAQAQGEKEIKAEVEGEKLKEQLLKMSEIALWLDTYDDIFSDFDPRPFSQRAMSVDFLDEIKRASRDKVSGQIELRFMIPKDLRKESEEVQIKKRLKDHFKKHTTELSKDKIKVLQKSIFFIFMGFAMLLLAALIDYSGRQGFLYSALIILLEPAGWFTFWFSLEQIFEHFKEKNPDIAFYEKMSKAEISFVSY